MPRIVYSLAPRGLNVNNDEINSPEGSLRYARNCMSFAGGGTIRSAPPLVLAYSNPTRGRSFTKFNDRWITFGEVTNTVRIERQNSIGGDAWSLLDHTALATPSVTFNIDQTSPTLWVTAPPTPERDEYLFMLDPANTDGDNGLVKIDDAGTLSHWGILPPAAADVTGVTVAAVPSAAGTDWKYIHSAASDALEASGDWTLATADETALKAATAISTSANPAVEGNSIKWVVANNENAQITRAYGADIDLTTFGSAASGNEDFIQFFIRIRNPARVQSVEIAFDTTTAGDFASDFYSRELTFKLVRGRKRKKLIGLGDLVKQKGGFKKIKDFLGDQSNTSDLTYSQTMGTQHIPVAKNTWSRITLPKNSFDESGTPNWANVRAIRFTAHTKKKGKTAIFLDRLTLNGGTGTLGDYEYTFTYSSDDGTSTSAGSRSNPAIDDEDGTTTGIPNSLVTVKVANIERQTIRLTFPALTFDAQTNRIEIWRTVGNGKEFFRAGYIDVSAAGGTLGAGATFDDSAADYYGLQASAAESTSGNNTSFAVLDPNEELPLDNTSPNDPDFAFQVVADKPHMARMWWGRNVETLGTQGLVYYSPAGRMEAVQGYVQVTSGATDPIQSLVVWGSRLFAFTKAAMYEIVGVDEPFVAQKIEGAPGTRQPYTVVSSTFGVLWVADDGVYLFNGQFAKSLSDSSLMPMLRHHMKVNSEFSTQDSANIRAVAGKNAYYIGDGLIGFSLIYDFDSGTWRYTDAFGLPAENTGAMYYDPTTGKVYGYISTNIYEVDARWYPVTGTQAVFRIQPQPFFRSPSGKQAILRKIWFDVRRGADSTSTSFTPSKIVDGTVTALPTFNPGAGDYSRIIAEYNINEAGYSFGARLKGSLVRNCIVNSIEMDIYVPGDTDEA